MLIDLPYNIKQKLWIIYKQRYLKEVQKLYLKKSTYYEEYKEEPVYDTKWVLKEKYLKEIIFDEDGLRYVFSDNEYLDNSDETDIEFYDDGVEIFVDYIKAKQKLEIL